MTQATQLELLSYSTGIPTLLELDLLADLPALKGLWVTTDTETNEEDARICKVSMRHLPHLQHLRLWYGSDDEFWDAVFASLGLRALY